MSFLEVKTGKMSQKAILHDPDRANEEIVNILLDRDELTWKTLIYELVREENMDPWDINVTKLAKRFMELIQTLQDMDFRITGKLVLAAALLLKIKSDHLLEEDLTALDSLIEGAENPVDLLEELPEVYEVDEDAEVDTPSLIPKTPQPRNRKVAVQDLVGALEKALKVEMRRVRPEFEQMKVEVEEIDISRVIKDVYEQIQTHFKAGKEDLTFDNLLPENPQREEKVFTFIPLLHLDHQRNIDLEQERTFGPIGIKFLKELDKDFAVPEGDLGTT